VAAIDRATWDALAARSPWATPFSRHGFHAAWWAAYGANVHDQTLVAYADDVDVDDVDADRPPDQRPSDQRPSGQRPIAIVPLMHRHEVEPGDADLHTRLRADSRQELTPVSPQAKAVFLGATYHADYATILAAPDDLPDITEALAGHLAGPPAPDDPHPEPWDAIDLRRLRCGDPAADALTAAFGAREIEHGWTLNVEREDVCPVATLPTEATIGRHPTLDDLLITLGKKERHEIRRKLRRADAVGPIRLLASRDPIRDLEAFIDLHQRRWGALGLFPPTPGGEQSRTFFRCLFDRDGYGSDPAVQLSFLTVGERRIGAAVSFDDGRTHYYYNAGIDPDARELSPGVVMVAKLVERAIEQGRHRFDFLRGDETYKYEWGATDEPIQRLLVRRTTA
jgi:hypothetical protein